MTTNDLLTANTLIFCSGKIKGLIKAHTARLYIPAFEQQLIILIPLKCSEVQEKIKPSRL